MQSGTSVLIIPMCKQSIVTFKKHVFSALFEIIWLLSALEKLGYGDFRKDAEDALAECKEVAAKRKRQNTRLENFSQEELRRQQQELFAKAREEAARQEMLLLQQQQQASSLQAQASAATTSSSDNPTPSNNGDPTKSSSDSETNTNNKQWFWPNFRFFCI